MSIYAFPLISCALCAALHYGALKLFPRWNLLDFPERYGHKRSPIPYPTGLLSVLTFLLMFTTLSPQTPQSAGIIAAISLLTLVSFIDDRYTVPAWVRLIVQAIVALMIFATGSRIYTITNPLEADGILSLDTVDIMTNLFGPLPLWSGVFTVFWLMLTMNALNWFDGIPGQVHTLSGIGFAVLGFLSLSDRVNQPEVAVLAFILAGIAVAGLLFDFPPSKVLMGDTGAMFFGLSIGILTIYSGGKVATAFLVLGVPLIDVFIVVVRRLLKGVNPMTGSNTNEHLHHRLLRKGWTARQVIALNAVLGTTFGVVALFISTAEKIVAGAVLFLVMLGLSWYSKD